MYNAHRYSLNGRLFNVNEENYSWTTPMEKHFCSNATAEGIKY